MTQTQIPFYTHAEDYLASPTPEIQLLRGELIINRCTLRIDKLHFKGGGGGLLRIENNHFGMTKLSCDTLDTVFLFPLLCKVNLFKNLVFFIHQLI